MAPSTKKLKQYVVITMEVKNTNRVGSLSISSHDWSRLPALVKLVEAPLRKANFSLSNARMDKPPTSIPTFVDDTKKSGCWRCQWPAGQELYQLSELYTLLLELLVAGENNWQVVSTFSPHLHQTTQCQWVFGHE